MAKCLIGQLVYVDRPPPFTTIVNSNVTNYDKLLRTVYVFLQILRVTELFLTVDESGIPNRISTD